MSDIGVLVAPGTLRPGATVELEQAELHHLRVRRVRAGDPVRLYDGDGAVAGGEFDGEGVQLTGAVAVAPVPVPRILAVGAGDKDRFLHLAGQCTALGVTHLIPLVTDRTHAVTTRYRDTARDRAERGAREACKQSGSPWATRVEVSCELSNVYTNWPGVQWWIADQGGEVPPTVRIATSAGCLVGPEGGWTPAEVAFAAGSLGAVAVRLAGAILRFETAALAAATLLHDRTAQ